MTRRPHTSRTDRLRYCAVARPFNAPPAILAAILAVAAFVAVFVVAPSRSFASEAPLVLALGDSLTAGYGLPPHQSFPAQLEAALREKGVEARVINGGVSGETSAGGLARIDWLLAEKPDLVIVELGANDGLRGLDPAATRDNLERIIERIEEAGAHVLLTGMKAPPNLGRAYGDAFASMYPELARRHGTAFYPFFLDGVVADPALNQEDGIHPTGEGVAVIVERMLPVVIAALKETSR